MNAAPSTFGAMPSPPARVFPAAPRGSSWREIPSSGLPRGLVLAAPGYVWSDGQFVYARALASANGTAYLLIRLFPRAAGLRTRFDRFYVAPAAASLGDPPVGSWQAWTGELPAPVGAAFQNGRRPGQDFRTTIGSHDWLVRTDAHGAASYALGAPPFTRRISVSAWRGRAAPPAAVAPASSPPPPPVAFLGDPSNPWPPTPPGWAETAPDDETRAGLCAGLLGELPMSHYVDRWTPSGLYRFFAYETGAGQKAIGSLRYWGAAMLGAPPASTLGDTASDKVAFDAAIAAGDAALAAGDWAGAVTHYQAAGNLGATKVGPDLDADTSGASQPLTQQAWGINTTLATLPVAGDAANAQTAQGLVVQMKALYEQAAAATPAAPPTPATTPLQQAAVAMNRALAAHGYKQADMGLYRAFQRAAGLTADGYPGAGTMNQLAVILTGLGQTLAPVTIYPWSSHGAYDGVNAPTVAEWRGTGGGGGGGTGPGGGGGGGGGTTPTRPVLQAGMSTGGVVATVLGVVAVVGAIGWAAYTGNLPSLTTKPT